MRGRRVIVFQEKNQESASLVSHLILLQAALRHGLVSLLLEGDDDQSDEDVDKEEREDHKVDHVEDGHLYPVAWIGTLVFKGGVHRVLQDTARRFDNSTGQQVRYSNLSGL